MRVALSFGVPILSSATFFGAVSFVIIGRNHLRNLSRPITEFIRRSRMRILLEYRFINILHVTNRIWISHVHFLRFCDSKSFCINFTASRLILDFELFQSLVLYIHWVIHSYVMSGKLRGLPEPLVDIGNMVSLRSSAVLARLIRVTIELISLMMVSMSRGNQSYVLFGSESLLSHFLLHLPSSVPLVGILTSNGLILLKIQVDSLFDGRLFPGFLGVIWSC